MTIWPVQKQTYRTTQKHVDNQGAIDIQKNIACVFFGYFLFYLFLFSIS